MRGKKRSKRELYSAAWTPGSSGSPLQAKTVGSDAQARSRHLKAASLESLLPKVVQVDPLHPVGGDVGDADVMVDHELGELLPIDQDYLRLLDPLT